MVVSTFVCRVSRSMSATRSLSRRHSATATYLPEGDTAASCRSGSLMSSSSVSGVDRDLGGVACCADTGDNSHAQTTAAMTRLIVFSSIYLPTNWAGPWGFGTRALRHAGTEMLRD